MLDLHDLAVTHYIQIRFGDDMPIFVAVSDRGARLHWRVVRRFDDDYRRIISLN